MTESDANLWRRYQQQQLEQAFKSAEDERRRASGSDDIIL